MDVGNIEPEQPSERLVQAHRQLLADSSIQFDLPAYVQPKPPAWFEPVAEVLRWLAPHMVYMFWTAVIVGAGLILILVILEVRGVAWRFPWQKQSREMKPEETWRPDTVVALTLLSEADALAAAGNYDEAVHLLMLRSVEDIARHMPHFLRPSLTARDIAGAARLPGAARAAFAQIALVVEAALFAKNPVGADGWRTARAAYERFAFSDAWA